MQKEITLYTGGNKNIIGETKLRYTGTRYVPCLILGYYYDGGYLVKDRDQAGCVHSVKDIYDGEVPEEVLKKNQEATLEEEMEVPVVPEGYEEEHSYD